MVISNFVLNPADAHRYRSFHNLLPIHSATLTVTGTLNANNLRMTGSTLASIDATGVIVETLKITGNVLSSTTTNGDIVITPNGTGKTTTTKVQKTVGT